MRVDYPLGPTRRSRSIDDERRIRCRGVLRLQSLSFLLQERFEANLALLRPPSTDHLFDGIAPQKLTERLGPGDLREGHARSGIVEDDGKLRGPEQRIHNNGKRS